MSTKYEDIDAVNWSTLKWMDVSAKHYRWYLEHPDNKPAYFIGNAVHVCGLEPEKFAAAFGVYPGKKKYVNKAKGVLVKEYSAWVGGNPGMIALGEAEMKQVKAMGKALREHPKARAALAGAVEYTLEWVDSTTGTKCKGRVDCAGSYITDLKTTKNIIFEKFRRDYESYQYYGQLAYYHDGAIAAKKIAPDASPPKIVALEKAGPYDIAIYPMSKGDLKIGREFYKELLQKREDCIAADWWPGAQPDEVELEVRYLPRTLQTKQHLLEEF